METKKYHITITENETGKVHYDEDTNIIIGAMHLGKDGVASIGAVVGNAFDVAATIDGVNMAIKSIGKQDPMALLISKLLGEDKDGIYKTVSTIEERNNLEVEE
jgi:hypothetical protein